MAGLVPAIHVFAERKQDVDVRAKPAHDERICAWYGPGSAAHRFAKSYALRCVRGTHAVFQAAVSLQS
jgi:hypothetical protein